MKGEREGNFDVIILIDGVGEHEGESELGHGAGVGVVNPEISIEYSSCIDAPRRRHQREERQRGQGRQTDGRARRSGSSDD